MRMDRYLPPDHPLSRFYRIGAALFGACLVVFGVLGLTNEVPLFTTRGIDILGLSSNGLLAVISVVVGAVLVAAAAWGGPVASSTTAVIGGLFVLSGLVNLVLLNTPWNLLAFRMQNVLFSLIAGLVLLFVGLYGRLSGGLPEDNPYVRYRHHEPPAEEDPEHFRAERRRMAELGPLCEAEIAVAEGHPTPEQEREVRTAAWRTRQEERKRAYEHYRSAGTTPEQRVSAQNPWADYEVHRQSGQSH
ncbi:DUF4383 domain-containing protein [Saccharopolyspora sp. HNM0983]|uniref:DUF4383 domain-containing protein n=1 Tax=Saccharopolyspora montiporae TaxID=2781240 RepID=A0A929B4P5_9PSEU|nr:DUF4383 domain-containing protein [Saccharopolyspora sp. HNM0983]MBE9373114.1 DUF4383 domain-containing protein [Saccharopolyspora sp. HNM0983]